MTHTESLIRASEMSEELKDKVGDLHVLGGTNINREPEVQAGADEEMFEGVLDERKRVGASELIPASKVAQSLDSLKKD